MQNYQETKRKIERREFLLLLYLIQKMKTSALVFETLEIPAIDNVSIVMEAGRVNGVFRDR
jgi:hypothetical protein